MNTQPVQLTVTLEGPATIDLSNGDGWLCLERYSGETGTGDLAPLLRYTVMVEISTGYPFIFWFTRIVSGLGNTGFRIVRIDVDYETTCGK
jgi:hypothetical protein